MSDRPPRRALSGVLLLDKPARIGSNAVLQHVKRLYRAERAGHTGTLDPLASGLLVICFGEATKFAAELLQAGKSYEARIALGTRTTTGDAEGEVLERRPVNASDERVAAALAAFRGDIRQTPPMFSALKRDGRPLYSYARRGETLERQARTVTIHSLELLTRNGEELQLALSCSKGTYVRTLAEDLGEALGCGAHLSGLVRTSLGPFRLADALGIERLERADPQERDTLLLASDVLLRGYPQVVIGEDEAARFRHGQSVPGGDLPGPVRVYGEQGVFLGLAWCDEGGALRPKRLLAVRETRAA